MTAVFREFSEADVNICGQRPKNVHCGFEPLKGGSLLHDKMDPKSIRAESYNYDLPDERIARHPLAQREDSKLLIFKNGVIRDEPFAKLPDHLPTESLIFFNDTKVIAARLQFRKASGALIEIFCLEPSSVYPDITSGMNATGSVMWNCLIGGASKWKPTQVLRKEINIDSNTVILEARFQQKLEQSFQIHLSWGSTHTFAEILQVAGSIPLPPYLKRETDSEDRVRYQTVYASEAGSVAAPTAGLHFSAEILQEIQHKGIDIEYVTLHVGAGTFKPVKAETLRDHEMHAEFIDVSLATIEKLISAKDRMIICVGTTSLRTIESLYWIGVKIINNADLQPNELSISQWYPYELKTESSAFEALSSIKDWMLKNNVNRIVTRTSILIAPGYQFRVVNTLITNFHQPQSTLLMLISAFIGESWRKVYDHALKSDYRFLSYGDSSLFFRQ